MKFVYKEEALREVISKEVFPEAEEEVRSFPLDHLITAIIKRTNGEKGVVNCILEVKEDGILMVLMDAFRADKPTGYRYLPFSEMQGIKIKRGKLNHYVTLQFKDGANYELQIMKRSSKHLPNQTENLERALSLMESKNLHDMKNKSHSNSVVQNKVMSFLYVTTLILFLLIAFYLWTELASDSFILMLVFLIGTAFLHFILFIVVGFLIDGLRDRKFRLEYNPIVREYERTGNAELFLKELQQITHMPKTEDGKFVYYFSLSTALHKTNRTAEALEYLDKIETTSERTRKMVKKQRLAIEEESLT